MSVHPPFPLALTVLGSEVQGSPPLTPQPRKQKQQKATRLEPPFGVSRGRVAPPVVLGPSEGVEGEGWSSQRVLTPSSSLGQPQGVNVSISWAAFYLVEVSQPIVDALRMNLTGVSEALLLGICSVSWSHAPLPNSWPRKLKQRPPLFNAPSPRVVDVNVNVSFT